MNSEFSIGLVEISGLGDAIISLDDMCKVADVEFVATERRLGGRLVTVVVKGELTAVKAAVDAGVARASALGTLKAHQVIARPHKEILPYLHLDKDRPVEPKSETAGTHVGAVKKKPAARKTASAKKPAAKRGRPKKAATQ